MSVIRLDASGTGPLHARIGASVRRAVADGDVRVGEQLPAARDLADSIGVNTNTVLRAYRDLRDEGLIELRRGRGAIVRDGAHDRAGVTALADQLIAEGARLGMTIPDLHTLLTERHHHAQH